jgi:hypothetical protein
LFSSRMNAAVTALPDCQERDVFPTLSQSAMRRK